MRYDNVKACLDALCFIGFVILGFAGVVLIMTGFAYIHNEYSGYLALGLFVVLAVIVCLGIAFYMDYANHRKWENATKDLKPDEDE